MPWHIDDDHPDCDGYAVVKDDDGSVAGCHDSQDAAEAQMAALYAEEEGRAEERAAVPVHHTATTDREWDGPGAVAGASNDEAVLRHMHASRDTDGDPSKKGTWHFPHHSPGTDTPANLHGVRNGLARLPQSKIPDSDKAGVEAHLRAHLEDAEKKAARKPPVRVKGRDELRALRAIPDCVAERVGDLGPVTVRHRGQIFVEQRLHRLTEFELTRADETVTVEGYATTYDLPYEVAGGPPLGWREIMATGACSRSVNNGADVRLLLNHDGMPLARTKPSTLQLESDDLGLRIHAELDMRQNNARDAVFAMERGDLDEMSFAFEVLKQHWDEDFEERTIEDVKLYDVSLVTFPANPNAKAGLSALHALQDSETRTDEQHMSLDLAKAIRDTYTI